MPMTISYLNILNNQPPAKRFQDTVVENSTNTNLLLHPQPDMFTTEQYDKNGSCFIWSSNLLVYGAWLQFNCSTKVSHPFIICEKNLNVNLTLQLFKRPSHQCTPRFLEFNGYCFYGHHMNCIKPLMPHIPRQPPLFLRTHYKLSKTIYAIQSLLTTFVFMDIV